jgi:hypothetical protein
MNRLFASTFSRRLRATGRRFVPAAVRHRIAAELKHWAHIQARSDPAFQRSMTRLGELADRHRGETCVIIGNGPSIAGEDFSKLKGVSTFCLNRGYLKWREEGLEPTYFMAVNDLVIEQFHTEIAKLRCPLLLPWDHHALFQENENAVFIEMRWHKRFFGDVRDGLWAGATVTFAAMQVAFHMGFETAILIGVDHRFKDQGPAHAEVLQKGDDGNHFAKDYFGRGVRWNLPDLEQSERSYRMADKIYSAAGRKIVDSTRGGALDVFEKMPLEEAIRRFGSGTA